MVVNQDVGLEIRRLHEEFREIFSPETIDRFAGESIETLRGSRIEDFVAIFVRRFTRERLKALAQAEGLIQKDRPEVLFVCVHNSGRSQMAAALMTHLSGGLVHVRSAGSNPAEQLNPAVVQVMREQGLDLPEAFPKPLTDEVVRAADAVITMGCGNTCPIYPGKRYEDWQLEDPAGQPIDKVREIRDQVERRVRGLLAELGVPGRR